MTCTHTAVPSGVLWENVLREDKKLTVTVGSIWCRRKCFSYLLHPVLEERKNGHMKTNFKSTYCLNQEGISSELFFYLSIAIDGLFWPHPHSGTPDPHQSLCCQGQMPVMVLWLPLAQWACTVDLSAYHSGCRAFHC